MKQNIGFNLITGIVQTIPLSIAETGTITTVGQSVTGVGTAFTTQFVEGDWLFVAAQSEIRQITRIISDTLMVIGLGFTVDISVGITPVKTPKSPFKVISVTNSGAAAGTLTTQDGIVSCAPGYGATWDKGARHQTGTYDYVDPVVVNATGTQFTYTTLQ